MKDRCCRSAPRCASCPVVIAAHARRAAATPDADPFAFVRAGAPRELPACVIEALALLHERRSVVAAHRASSG